MSFKVHPEVKEVFQKWLKYLSNDKGYSKHTIQAYLSDFYYFIAFMTAHLDSVLTMETFSYLSIQDFRSWLAARSISQKKAASNARALSVIRAFFKYLKVYYKIDNQAPFLLSIKRKSKKMAGLKESSNDKADHIASMNQLLTAYTNFHPRGKAQS
jgi:integrase/recombinase XerC